MRFGCLKVRQWLTLLAFVLLALPVRAEWPFSGTAVGPHTVRVLNDGVIALEARLQMIEHARKSIDLMVYLFGDDDSSGIVLHALMKKAKAGVRVRLLLDWYTGDGHPSINDSFATAIMRAAPGIEIRYYNRGTIVGSLGRVNHRNHAKMMVVDEKDVLVGGRNIGDDYFSLNEGGFDYIDRDLWVSGSIGHIAHAAFNAYWTARDWVTPARNETPTKLAKDFVVDWNEDLRAAVGRASHLPRIFKVSRVRFAIDKPGHSRSDRIVSPIIDSLLRSSDRYLLIENYSLPMSSSRTRLLKDVAVKVPVVLVTNSFESHDSPGVSAYSQTTEAELMRSSSLVWLFTYRGRELPNAVRIAGRTPPTEYSTHAKSFVSFTTHGSFAAVGSANFDVRSEKTNNEVMLIVDDPAVVREVARDISYRMSQSHPMSVAQDGRMFYSDTGEYETRVFEGLKKAMQRLGLGRLYRSLY